MTHDVECPYCGAGQDINHDDGYGYTEDEKHEQYCGGCGKTFVFTTCISFDYDTYVADCLNGSPHNYQPTRTYPREYSEMECSDCGIKRPCTPEEMESILTTPKQ